MARSFAAASNEYLAVTSAVLTGLPLAMACQFWADDLDDRYVLMSLNQGSTGYHYRRLEADGYAAGDVVVARQRAGGTIGTAQASIQFTASAQHHACALFISDTRRDVYYDGASSSTDTADTGAITTPNATSIGAIYSAGGGDEHMNGDIAEAGIWDLSVWPGATDADKAAEFARVAIPALAAGYAPSFFMLGLAAYWQLIRDEDQDRVGGYDLTAYNTPSIATHPPQMKYPMPPRLWHITAAAPPPTVALPIFPSPDAIHSQVFGGVTVR